MCGIAGILGTDDRALGGRMADRLAHRGPDGSGAWTDQGITLAHRRLAILDVEHAQQPMTDATGRFTIVYNGECYNHGALREDLARQGVRFRTTADTETVLEGYRVWGPDVLRRMEGMFAFAVWDSHERRLFIARDPWGIKPFFHAWTHDGDWVFASEQKALFAHPGLTAIADTDRLKERIALEFLTGQGTLFQGVHQLPPGTWAHVAPGDDAVLWHLYYQVPAEAYASPDEAAAAIRARFEDSVQEQLMSDVPLGVVLSGGLDSAAVVAAFRDRVPDATIRTFTVAGSEDVPDVRAARQVAEAFATEHHESLFGLEDVWRGMPAWTYANENVNYTESFFGPLFASMRPHVKVGLCGQGSDELWGGYQRYQDPAALAAERLRRLHRCRPRHMDELSALVAMTHQSGPSLAEWDQQGQLANFQLRLVDRSSMAHGLEVRVPFLSRPLHAASRAVPWAWKMHAGVEKWVLRKALLGLGIPDGLLSRTKVPAGRATAPGVMDAFEEEAARIVNAEAMQDHPMGPAFGAPAAFLVYRLWEEAFITHQADPAAAGRLTLEDVA